MGLSLVTVRLKDCQGLGQDQHEHLLFAECTCHNLLVRRLRGDWRVLEGWGLEGWGFRIYEQPVQIPPCVVMEVWMLLTIAMTGLLCCSAQSYTDTRVVKSDIPPLLLWHRTHWADRRRLMETWLDSPLKRTIPPQLSCQAYVNHEFRFIFLRQAKTGTSTAPGTLAEVIKVNESFAIPAHSCRRLMDRPLVSEGSVLKCTQL
jgi:hypothetical protein